MSLVPATLIKRYKRFLADVRLADGRELTAHCPNPGAMTGLCEEGMRVFLRPVVNPQAKLPYRWVITETESAYVGVDTMRANSILSDGLKHKIIPSFQDIHQFTPEVKVSSGTRLDFCLYRGERPMFLEVKSVTLSKVPTIASFPDTATQRGQKHLQALMKLKHQGADAGLFFVVQRDDCQHFNLASEIDPVYAKLCYQAMAIGVSVYIWDCTIEPWTDTIRLRRALSWNTIAE